MIEPIEIELREAEDGDLEDVIEALAQMLLAVQAAHRLADRIEQEQRQAA